VSCPSGNVVSHARSQASEAALRGSPPPGTALAHFKGFAEDAALGTSLQAQNDEALEEGAQ